MRFDGIGVSSGIAMGRVCRLERIELGIHERTIEDVHGELESFNRALEESRKDICRIRSNVAEKSGQEEVAIFDAHLEMVADPEISRRTAETIGNDKIDCASAYKRIIDEYIEMFESMDNEYMRGRASDLRDISGRVLGHMAGVTITDTMEMDEGSIIMSVDITPSDTALLDRTKVRGIVSEKGGRTCHSAIMARSMGIPSVTGTEGIMDVCNDGDRVIIDGIRGCVILNPSDRELEEYSGLISDREKKMEGLKGLRDEKTLTLDGHRIEVSANIGSPEEVCHVLSQGGDGVGLFRTEFMFMERKSSPGEEEQYQVYRKVLEEMGDRPVVIRTLDVGGDKDIEYLEMEKEMNPFLGKRGIRLCLDRVDVFKCQMRALIRAGAHGKLRIMFPMISVVEEFRRAREIYDETLAELKAQGYPVGENTQVGMMVETPGAVLLADAFAREADFFSVGTNDLIQYTFAADRMNDRVDYLYQPLNPTILRMIKMVIDAAHREGKRVAMCGEAASNLEAVPVLLGLGLDEFSMSPSSILEIKGRIMDLDRKVMEKLAGEVITMTSQEEVLAHVRRAMSS